MRAVYRDMLTLFDPLLEVEGRHATEAELELVHSPEYLSRVQGWAQEAAAKGRSIEVEPGVVVSEASWDAARAAAGSVLHAIDTVLAGTTRNAFCPVRPPGRDVRADLPGGFGLVNSTAIAARYLAARPEPCSVLVLEWAGLGPSRIRSLVAGTEDVRVAAIFAADENGEARPEPLDRILPEGAGATQFREALRALLESAAADPPDFILLSAGFDVLASDPLGRLSLETSDVYHLTRDLREWADRVCGGRLVSILEGGYDVAALGPAVVQHLHALADLGPVG